MALAKAVGAKVTGFFAAPPATPIVYRHHLPVGFAQPAEHEKLIEKTTAEYLGFIEQTAKEAGVPFEGAHKTDDYPAHAILEIAAKKGCDLIVMGTQATAACAACSSAACAEGAQSGQDSGGRGAMTAGVGFTRKCRY